MKQTIQSTKDVKITAKVDFEGQLREVEVTKFDTKNNVCAFNISMMGKKIYIGAGEGTPKLSDLQDITFTFVE